MKTNHEDLGSELTKQVIAAAIAVHREFGPGLDEADYERALHLELLAMGIEHQCQVPLPLLYKNTKLDCGYRMDILVAGWLLLELKAVEKLHPLHEAQLITYLRLAKLKLGLIMNFGSLFLRDGILRRANSSAPKSRLYAPREAFQAMDDLSREAMDAAFEVQHLLVTGLLRRVDCPQCAVAWNEVEWVMERPIEPSHWRCSHPSSARLLGDQEPHLP